MRRIAPPTSCCRAEALTVTRITVSGNTRLSRGEVLSLLDGLHGTNMVTVDLEDWRQKLLASPWVADAAMRRVLPGTVDVVIAERAADGHRPDRRRACISSTSAATSSTSSGRTMPTSTCRSSTAWRPAPRESGLLIDDARAALAGRLLAALQAQPELARRMSQIDVTDARDAVVILKDDTALVRIGDDQFVERLQSYLDLAPALRERVPDIDYVDLRFDERVYVRPQGREPAEAHGLREAGDRRPAGGSGA